MKLNELGWRTEHANRAALVVDAADYYAYARKAMMGATDQIILVGWDFDSRIILDRSRPDDGAPTELGPFLSWLADNRPGLQINILAWSLVTMKLLGRGTTVLRLARWMKHKQITFKTDGAHPFGASHHQKIIVIDNCMAFCGGIDMTASRWDTRQHLDNDERRRRPFTERRYMPWHDASMALEGPVAGALGDLARARWEIAGGDPLPVPQVACNAWPDALRPQFEDIEVTIGRTRGLNGEIEEIREIEALFVAMIERVERYAYIETQYFASRVIAEAITKRLDEENGPEFVIVNPKVADGWLEEEVMGAARAELIDAMREHPNHHRAQIYTPVTHREADIYVHAKVMIADDRVLRVGSANMNNRSMGLDSECDVVIEATDDAMIATIAGLRAGLMAEHLGVEPEVVEQTLAKTGSLIETVERLRGSGRSLVPFDPPEKAEWQRVMANAQALDPEHPEAAFEPSRRGLTTRVRDRARRVRGRLRRRI
ncbi:phospholipase D-like domain-containing protein [Sphingomonas sp. S1-29]|uniref:phospholipase D-like domain-containing protein n=1 Tax=Sphingomonas sp. S1-29 TaxID=2991074 RepID=UPI00223F32B6|nr:phospholipase D-like domain-containing protein [Sphingomonas sp. S1-29]UZK68170.1 phospholipase D-like domain-containing protein [Sphingomonas sp. S1-29]